MFKILKILNALNGVWLDTYNQQIIIREELEKLQKILQEKLILKISNFQSKLEIFTRLKKRIASALVFLVMKIRKNIQSICQEILSKYMLICY